MEKKIFYLCDGEIESCPKRMCYKNLKKEEIEAECRHTSDIKHAVNFKITQNGESNYYENTSHADKTQPVENQRILLKYKKQNGRDKSG